MSSTRAFALLLLIAAVGCEGTITPVRPFTGIRDAGPAGDGGDADRDGGGSTDRDGGPDTDAGNSDAGDPDRDGGTNPRDGGVPEAIEACAAPVRTILETHLSASPGRASGGYQMSDGDQRTALSELVAALFVDDVGTATAASARAGYVPCRAADVVVLVPSDPSQGHAAAVIRPAGAAKVVFEAPHARYETDTASVSLSLFDRMDAVALVTSGAHRCANDVASGCDGTTRACSATPEPYVESDMAHNVDTAFHALHEAIFDAIVETSTVISVHGKGGNGAIISNGTQQVTTADEQIGRLVLALDAERPNDAILTCNPFIGGTTAGQLCGTTNVQGRHVNGSANACTMAAGAATDRFIHLELSLEMRMDPEAIENALRAALR